ncbi:MAG TPA: hypothetical protein VG222_17170 [Vicinamibacterales bacterium]|nr:hypothetical protein [Vicinamibacterales bacterium]
MAKRKGRTRGFVAEHSLTIVVATIWGLWLLLYRFADPQTHLGAFFGNSIADWLGTLAFVVLTKYFCEIGSKESHPPHPHWHNRLLRTLSTHSLSLVIVATGAVWVALFAHADPNGKVGQVYGNIVSEWGQLLALILMTKYFREKGSKES